MKNNSKPLDYYYNFDALVANTKERIKNTEQGKEFIIADLFLEDNWYITL